MPLDLAALEDLVTDTGLEMAQRLLRVFLDDAAQQVERALVAAEGSDHTAIGNIAHSLKSSAATFGAPQLAQAARELELEVAQGNAGPVLDKLLDLQCKFALTRQAMESKLETLESSQP